MSIRLRLPRRLDPHRRRWIRFWRRRYLRTKVTAPAFSIVAANCWGSQIYQDMGRPYLTPFVGLYMSPKSFLRFCENYDVARTATLTFRLNTDGNSTSPVGLLLDEIEIHFVHYRTEEEARSKWVRRCARLPARASDCHYMMCDRDGCTDEDIARFFALPVVRKVFFAARSRPPFSQVIVVPPRDGGAMVEDGVELYDQCASYFDLAGWLNSAP